MRQVIELSNASRMKVPNFIPSDKSIAHRALLFSAIANGESSIQLASYGNDVRSTIECLKGLGVDIEEKKDLFIVKSPGGITADQAILDCGNSGTTIRLLMGMLSSVEGHFTLNGDSSLAQRPMKRVALPLTQMGAKIELTNQDYAPIHITGGKLKAIEYELPVASAQVKSAVMLAALNATGVTKLFGKIQSRDHTERLLAHFGVQIKTNESSISIEGGQELKGTQVKVPSDTSSAAFWIAAALIIPDAEIELKNILLNPTRIGFINVLREMGADISISLEESNPEPVGSIKAKYSQLQGLTVASEQIPYLIDELPLFSVIASLAKGKTIVEGAFELRHKESDRIKSIVKTLNSFGVRVKEKHDGFEIEGPNVLRANAIDSFQDHRIVLMATLAALVAKGSTKIYDPDCVEISYPNFFSECQKAFS